MPRLLGVAEIIWFEIRRFRLSSLPDSLRPSLFLTWFSLNTLLGSSLAASHARQNMQTHLCLSVR